MRAEYDFPPGQGVRGKYYERYRASVTPAITAVESPFVSPVRTAVQYPIARIALPIASPVHLPSPMLQLAHASQGPPRE
jgi:hypothetical protein